MRQNSCIPDHSSAALEEAFQAALLNLAFKQMEQEELAMMHERVNRVSQNPQETRFAQKLGQRLRRQRTRALMLHTLPRIAQVAACLIAVISIGAGVALAASQEARSWAAGILTGTIDEETNGFWNNETHYRGITDGVALEDSLLLVEDKTALLLQNSTEAEPVRYEWRARGERRIEQLTADGGSVYAVCERAEDGPVREGGMRSYALDRYSLGKLTLNVDGSFTVSEMRKLGDVNFPAPEGEGEPHYTVEDAVAVNGKLYFIIRCYLDDGSFFGMDECYRLYACDLASGAVAELALPGGQVMKQIGDSYRLFAGENAYVAFLASEGGAEIFRIDADGSLSKRAEFPAGRAPNSFACRIDGTLYFQRDAAIYAAPNFDIEGARRVALSGGVGGRGVLIGENSYVIISTEGVAEVFNFDDEPGEVTELVVGGGIDSDMNTRIREANLGITLVEDAVSPGISLEEYAQKLLSGEARADLVSVINSEGALYHAGWGKPIQDEALCAMIDRMPEGMRRYVTKDGAYIGIPCEFFAYGDIKIHPRVWAEYGRGEEEVPETWLELMQLLNELSHGPDAGKFSIYAGHKITGDTADGSDAALLLSQKMTDGFARSWAARGQEPDFGGADFREAFEMLQVINFGALRYASESDAQENILIEIMSDGYEPGWPGDITLKIHPQDVKVSRGLCFVERIHPDAGAEAEAAAYAYLRARHADGTDAYNRLRCDFTTPASELAKIYGDNISAEAIESYREQVGDVWLDSLSEDEQNRRDAALIAYARGEMDFDALADVLNDIYAN